MSNILHTLDRKEGIAQAAPNRHTAVRKAAEALSRRNVDQATTELLNEALARLTVLCYERDDTRQLCNVDGPTGRILLPLPWGRAGYAKWGLAHSEAEAMRAIMFARQRQGLPLYFYDRNRRSWYVNLADYPVIPVLDEWEITVSEYRSVRSDNGSYSGSGKGK